MISLSSFKLNCKTSNSLAPGLAPLKVHFILQVTTCFIVISVHDFLSSLTCYVHVQADALVLWHLSKIDVLRMRSIGLWPVGPEVQLECNMWVPVGVKTLSWIEACLIRCCDRLEMDASSVLGCQAGSAGLCVAIWTYDVGSTIDSSQKYK